MGSTHIAPIRIMKRLGDLLSEDTNQFGPGTDLAVSMLAVMIVMTIVVAQLYKFEAARAQDLSVKLDSVRPQAQQSGNFRMATDSFSAADFHARPVTKLVDPESTSARVARIVAEYEQIRDQYPYVFVIGHSNQLDDPKAEDQSLSARRRRNWEYASRRAVLIATLMQQRLDDPERLVVVTTGELDLRDKDHPTSQKNAWVEVVFGKEWKRPAPRK